MWPFKNKPRPEPAPYWSHTPGMTQESVSSALLSLFGQGSHLALFYANMNGFRHGVIDPANAAEFSRLILAEPAFDSDNIAFAVARLTESTDILCGLDSMERLAFGDGPVDPARLADLLTLRSAVLKTSTSSVFSEAGFDPRQWLVGVTVARRKTDLEAIAERLEDRKRYLKPLLLRARAKGKNKYGETEWSSYVEELQEFMEHYFPEGTLPFFHVRLPIAYAIQQTDVWLDEEVDDLSIPIDGIDFEHWCAKQLEGQGWAVRVSQASGDQGVDIEATKSGLTVAIQCKRYTTPIGNKSVQEAHAGMDHYQADLACVIGTGGFTKAALELAASTRVLLLDAANIGSFSDLVVTRAQPSP